jgi:general stress protein CsbA
MFECQIMDEFSAAIYPINSCLYWLRTVSTRNKYIWFDLIWLLIDMQSFKGNQMDMIFLIDATPII